jgi:hypothetical protein
MRSPARRSLFQASASANALDGPVQFADSAFRHRRQLAGDDEQRLDLCDRALMATAYDTLMRQGELAFHSRPCRFKNSVETGLTKLGPWGG